MSEDIKSKASVLLGLTPVRTLVLVAGEGFEPSTFGL